MQIVNSLRVAIVITFLLIAPSYISCEPVYTDLNITCVTPEITDFSTVFLLSHGLDPRKSTGIRQAKEYIDNNVINGMCYTFNYSDSFSNVNFGQEDDCNRLFQAYTYICNIHPLADIILVGLSRGSVVILHLVAIHEAEKLAQIKLIILESPFDTLENIIQHVSHKYCWFIPSGKNLLKKLVGKLPNYKIHGLQPIDYAKQICSEIPFLISYSLEDKVVPVYAAQNIINALLENGNDVTVVKLEKGKHSTASFQENFQTAAHTFLKPKSLVVAS